MKKNSYLSTTLRATSPTPILNRPDFDHVFKELPLESQGLLQAVEMIALKDTCFTLVKTISETISQVQTEDYPSKIPLYIDNRFIQKDQNPTPRDKTPPPKTTIIAHLKASLGLPYIWGGNWSLGIPLIETLYPNQTEKKDLHLLRGVDCSGLLYEATNGYTPRNTAQLCSFGKKIPTLSDIKPLDIIVWPGHVIICLTKTTVIESQPTCGVIETNLHKRMACLETKTYIIRRIIN